MLTRAASLWQAGHPHQAITLLMEAGFTDSDRRDFVAVATSRARTRYTRAMARYTE